MDNSKDNTVENNNVENNTVKNSNEKEVMDHDSCIPSKCYMKNSKYCFANFCISCGINMGEHNPRQYCRKNYCPDEYIDN